MWFRKRGRKEYRRSYIYIQRPYLEDSLAFFVSFRLVGNNSCFVSSLSVCLLDENGKGKTSVISLYGVPYRQNSSVSACVTPIEHRTLVVAVVYATSILYQTFTSTLNSPHSPPNPLTNQPSHHLLIPIPITHPPLSLSFSLSPDSLFQNTPPPNFSFLKKTQNTNGPLHLPLLPLSTTTVTHDLPLPLPRWRRRLRGPRPVLARALLAGAGRLLRLPGAARDRGRDQGERAGGGRVRGRGERVRQRVRGELGEWDCFFVFFLVFFWVGFERGGEVGRWGRKDKNG